VVSYTHASNNGVVLQIHVYPNF